MKRIIPKIGRVRDRQTGQLVPGVVIRHPQTLQRLPAAGILVDRVDAYWRRRAREGGVRIVDEPVAMSSDTTVAPAADGQVDLGTASTASLALAGAVETRLGELLQATVDTPVDTDARTDTPAIAPPTITGPTQAQE